ncbi:tRNA uridine-5-carboxymethylaminomethyl(34) synthesis GTPase MnmE [Enterovirga aerilata]|uniref:tRNA modification GTPase MnmE n=1 Tax=Enterovirga aerilata TaxID=2730920 RepID=A0A849IIC4_9HYPH|nr:tRNA uridine-5-carboxymethylaminomethyl(34) synthesis GTPase MnmE [Enterovirga sp. DB1703]NNM73693.1 tRNA uridine-5-carboxymethylaminomethyl(34) synthesis GTPase MnmE [Enterovirga sp. DB1703]
MTSGDTIFAVASGFGRAGIAVIRISGPGTEAALHALVRGPAPPPRRASLRRLHHPVTGEVLDQALVLRMAAPGSFTGEDQAELHIHGGLAVRSAVLRALSSLPGLRAAEPGEFTRRAFLNGRMDLSAVEGLADLIDAETEAQRRQALRQLEGALANKVDDWRDRLADALALAEAGLDFTDEADVSHAASSEAAAIFHAVRLEIEDELARSSRAERLREGFVAVIAGPPNAGKSTLLNALARREVAIVSPHPGTTRDAIEVRCDLDGLPVTFVDTAGLREAADPVEGEGIARARRHARGADLVLWLVAPDAVADGESFGPVPVLNVATKSDLADRPPSADLAVSARTGDGIGRLVEAVRERAEAVLAGAGDAVVTRERHRKALEEVVSALSRAEAAQAVGHEELAAEDLRLALRALGRVTGRVDVEEILDRIFGQFCIGK